MDKLTIIARAHRIITALRARSIPRGAYYQNGYIAREQAARVCVLHIGPAREVEKARAYKGSGATEIEFMI